MDSETSTEVYSDISGRLEARCGKIPVSGRYHRPPQRIEDDYAFTDRVLGTGATGVVTMATRRGEVDGSQRFAVKAFNLNLIPQSKIETLQMEVEIFLSVDHPHICRLYDVYETEDTLHLVMECMEGGELFDRLKTLKKFCEKDAADAVWQMLLAVNYIHAHGVVHRDLKLENFLYDTKNSNHLKLIDFGLSAMRDANYVFRVSCGTLCYVAPEVLLKRYNSQCDMWSLGVIVFILLSGHMPFFGPRAEQVQSIMEGRYTMKSMRWDPISRAAKDFTEGLMKLDPDERLTAQEALEHPWILGRQENQPEEVDANIVQALLQFGQASKFRRCCLELMAWSLSNEERAQVRQYFVAMDKDHSGTITLQELKEILEDRFELQEEETRRVFDAMDSNQDEEIHYSNFLAAMLSMRISLHDDLIRSAFKKFDADRSGYITLDEFEEVLGDVCSQAELKHMMERVDLNCDGKISYNEFVAYLSGEPLLEHADSADRLISEGLLAEPSAGGAGRGVAMMRKKCADAPMSSSSQRSAPLVMMNSPRVEARSTCPLCLGFLWPVRFS